MRTFIATTPFMVRDHATELPRHFAPTSGPIDEALLEKLQPGLRIADDYMDQGVLRLFDPVKDARPEVVSVGKPPDPMLYVRTSKPPAAPTTHHGNTKHSKGKR